MIVSRDLVEGTVITTVRYMKKTVRVRNISATVTAILMQPGHTTYWEIKPGEEFTVPGNELPPELRIAGHVRVEEIDA